MTLLRRETLAFAQQKWPGYTLYHYGLCELAQRQAVSVRKDKPSGRAIKSDRAKVVMTAGCISKTFDISNYIYILMEIANSINQKLRTKFTIFSNCSLGSKYEKSLSISCSRRTKYLFTCFSASLSI